MIAITTGNGVVRPSSKSSADKPVVLLLPPPAACCRCCMLPAACCCCCLLPLPPPAAAASCSCRLLQLLPPAPAAAAAAAAAAAVNIASRTLAKPYLFSCKLEAVLFWTRHLIGAVHDRNLRFVRVVQHWITLRPTSRLGVWCSSQGLVCQHATNPAILANGNRRATAGTV